MKVKAAQGLARILKAEGVPWVACYPTNHVNNALGAEDVPILMMREERYAVAVADSFSRVTGGQQIGVCTIMGGLNAAGIQLAYGAVAQAFEDSSPVLVITAGVPQCFLVRRCVNTRRIVISNSRMRRGFIQKASRPSCAICSVIIVWL